MSRPEGYYYWKQLLEHIGNPDVIFNGELIYPRQLEIHLPSNQIVPCNFGCYHCAGKNFQKDLGSWEMEGLELLRDLGSNIPYHIYGGSYTEPVLNPYFLTYLHMTKKQGCHFGIHTNGSTLLTLEETQGWFTILCKIATDKVDYLSVSLDAGTTASHKKGKLLKQNYFSQILAAIRLFTEIRKDKPAIRMCYLMNRFNSSQKEIDRIVSFAKSVEVDSLRFSIPFANYNQPFDVVKKYRDSVEQPRKPVYFDMVRKHLSTSQRDTPFIFWMSPDLQDITLYNFKQCAYGYYQVCMGADGYYYPCTTISSPSFKELRLGKISSSLEFFKEVIRKNQNPRFNCSTCFTRGARGNRMALEINRKYAQHRKKRVER